MLDEAHATGCLGPGGRGLAAQLGVESAVDVAMGTLSKAVGSFGAFAAGSQLLVDYLVNTARSFLFTTALPPSIVSASLAAIDVIEREPWRQARLEENGRALREGLRSLGLDTLASASHIVPVAVGESARALAMAAALRGEGVFAVAIRPPTVPAGQARIRASVMATHNGSDVELALRAFAAAARAVGLLPGSAGLR
jgi:7-keto-8-aminopelargonate synthetase-like enzyme